ncbi:MAG: N-acetyltransferase, partial [Candidatus Eremiobacteraeota bacterium]|nr:N-acetyltransferase [Candidatus Eremiobacteraeota bacterium]
EALFGRNWGCLEHFDCLHFELCYYQAIELAIARGLARVEAGAQGQHKLQRGYLPVPTYSAHFIADTAFRGLIDRYLREEKAEVRATIAILGQRHSPYKNEVEQHG